jgi:hypothetical protein
MATRSVIAYLENNEVYHTIYCHWDGYPSNNGRILKDHYNTEDKVRELIEQGDLSSLGDTIAETDSYRSRGETDTEAREFSYLYDIVDAYPNCEWVYVYEGLTGQWRVVEANDYENRYKAFPLTEELIASNIY